MELVNTYIDYDKIFERELLKKLEDFYNAMDWGEVLSSTKTAEKFLLLIWKCEEFFVY